MRLLASPSGHHCLWSVPQSRPLWMSDFFSIGKPTKTTGVSSPLNWRRVTLNSCT